MRDVIALVVDPFLARVYADLDESLEPGRPCAELSAAVIAAVIEADDVDHVGVFVDVVGGHVEVPASILVAARALQ